uniref:AlNc14C124G6751 protein n=1 Tax=Albugo laibachii Nc14 TaxID=890382 RepID=F0WJM7_9STRA|nr:AlNc14C124G6751 [Albugo laibachii Nc14]|eukprot:CCA21476.1 AlNc14C124G6751 [Albugo laibachii Nc14]
MSRGSVLINITKNHFCLDGTYLLKSKGFELQGFDHVPVWLTLYAYNAFVNASETWETVNPFKASAIKEDTDLEVMDAAMVKLKLHPLLSDTSLTMNDSVFNIYRLLAKHGSSSKSRWASRKESRS